MLVKDSIKQLSRGEWSLWGVSVAAIALTSGLSGSVDALSVAASLIGVTALIFVAKGLVLGQMLTVVFALFYGFISLHFRYYGEMMTYLCMTAPIALMSVISWLRHPYADTPEVEVARVTGQQAAVMLALAAVVTAVFYFLLRALGNACLTVSTISITTSFLASYLTFLRSPWYALAYSANDLVLIILWWTAAAVSPEHIPMVVCFAMFLFNDIYGFVNWQRIRRRQADNSTPRGD